MKLDGKVALITGAASGIGHAIARRYVEAGGKVVIADLNVDGAGKAANELGDTKTAIGVAMDVSKEDQVNAGVERAVNAFGRIDILVSNAGSRSCTRPRFPFADWREVSCDPSGRRVSDHQGLRQAHVPAEVRRADLYGISAQP